MLRSTLIILLSFCFGCGPSVLPPLQKWNIIITSPAGHSVTYNVESYDKPLLKTHNGGQISFVDNGASWYHDWEKSIIAPTGWLAEVKMVAEKSERSE
jgi:hypothetical protein